MNIAMFYAEPQAWQLSLQLELQTAGFLLQTFTHSQQRPMAHGMQFYKSLVFCVPYLDRGHIEMADKIQSHWPAVELVFIVDDDSQEVRQYLQNRYLVSVINRATELKDLVPLLRRTKQRPSQLRRSSRCERQDGLTLVTSEGLCLRANFVDYAKTGACIEMSYGELKPQSMVIIRYESSTQKRMHEIYAVIVWRQELGGLQQLLGRHQSIGCKFIAIAS